VVCDALQSIVHDQGFGSVPGLSSISRQARSMTVKWREEYGT